MVEVFKTDVSSKQQAKALIEIIQYRFKDYKVNFDLDDCDNILRVEADLAIEIDPLIGLLNEMDVQAEVLADVTPLIII